MAANRERLIRRYQRWLESGHAAMLAWCEKELTSSMMMLEIANEGTRGYWEMIANTYVEKLEKLRKFNPEREAVKLYKLVKRRRS